MCLDRQAQTTANENLKLLFQLVKKQAREAQKKHEKWEAKRKRISLL